MRRKPLTKSLKQQIFARDNYACRYCGRILPEDILQIDHIVPRALGGSDELDNLATACPNCNYRKGAKELSQYLAETVTQNREFYKSFLQSLDETKSLTQTAIENEPLKKSLNKLLFVNVIAAMETYLSDAFINTVLEDRSLIRKLVETR